MKTVKEKMAVNDEFVKSFRELIPKMEAARKSGNIDEMAMMVGKHLHICLPVLQMYTDEIENAINPIYRETAFIVVVALETMAETIKKRLNVNDEQVESLRDMVKINIEQISCPREIIRKGAAENG